MTCIEVCVPAGTASLISWLHISLFTLKLGVHCHGQSLVHCIQKIYLLDICHIHLFNGNTLVTA